MPPKSRFGITPRKLPPSLSEAELEEKEKQIQAEKEAEKAREKGEGSFHFELPWDVRCLVYKHLNFSDLWELKQHPLYKEVTDCVEEIVVDMEMGIWFLHDFPKVRKLSGPFVKRPDGFVFQNFGLLHVDRQELRDASWRDFVKRIFARIELDHIALNYSFAHVEEVTPTLPARWFNELTALQTVKREVLQKILEKDPLNLGIYVFETEEKRVPPQSKKRNEKIGEGIFERGYYPSTLSHLLPFAQKAKKGEEIVTYWLTGENLRALSLDETKNQGNSGQIGFVNSSLDHDPMFTEKIFKNAGISRYARGQIGLDREGSYNPAHDTFNLANIRRNYKGKLPLFIQDESIV